jgi:hypothetical protein
MMIKEHKNTAPVQGFWDWLGGGWGGAGGKA